MYPYGPLNKFSSLGRMPVLKDIMAASNTILRCPGSDGEDSEIEISGHPIN